MYPIWGSLFWKFFRDSNPNRISVTCVATIQIQSGDFVSLIPTQVPVFQTCAFHITFLILWFWLAIDNFSMKRIWLRFRAGIYPIMHICLSLSAQFFCRIKLVSFWVHLNVRPTFVIFEKLSWPSVFQYTTNNHAPGRILVNINFPNTYFIGMVTESWRYMLLSLIPSEWTWHCVYLLWIYPGFSIIFRIKSFMSLQLSFQINNF